MFWYIIIGGVAVVSLSSAIIKDQKNKKQSALRKEAERKALLQRQEALKLALQPLLQEVALFNVSYKEITSKNQFVSNFDAFQFQSRYRPLYEGVWSKEYRGLPDFGHEIKVLNDFERDYLGFESSVEGLNEQFIKNELELCSLLLDNVEGKSLDIPQRRAVILNQDNNLVIAGAGSGKTTTIAGKVKYLTERLKVDPKELLLISFTNKSSEEMADRIRKKMGLSLEVKTFHKLGLDIIGHAEGKKPSVFSLSPKETKELVASFIKNAKGKKDYLQKALDFLAYHLKPYKDVHDFTTDSEHNNYLREQKLEGYKIVEKITADGQTIRYRERFKSQEEVLIANFLFRNNIEYVYEEKYQYKTASKKFGQYKPDFFLPGYGIYIEHFGIDENGRVPHWFKGGEGQSAQERYSAGIEWKRNEHLFNGTILIETYSWEQRKGTLLPSLQSKLIEAGVAFEPMPDTDLWDYLATNTPEDIDVFTQLVATFLSLFKSNNEDLTHLMQRAKKEDNARAIQFLELFSPILGFYQNFLTEAGDIDFSDMVNRATAFIREGIYQSHYSYIIIDEFQDISQSRFQLIKALLDQDPGTKLFCVGDDWQSIFRFAGSDIGLFTGFSEYFKPSPLKGFEKATTISYIENTYRFDSKMIELSGNFILKNPNQISKSLKSSTHSQDRPVTVHWYQGSRSEREATRALENAFDSIVEKAKGKKSSVLVLGRYGNDGKILEQSGEISKRYNPSLNRSEYRYKGHDNISIHFLTAHSSKGLEADYTILVNGNSGTYGFPSEISDDPLLSFLLSKADSFPNGEERRLFYVALTRAKKHVHILASSEAPSKFVTEIEANEPVTSLRCEWCDNGRLVERQGPFGYFYSCNNGHYCNYTRKIGAKDFYTGALQYMNNKDFLQAITYFDKVLELDATYPKVQYLMGKCFHLLKESAKAADCLTQAIALGDPPQDVYTWRGAAYVAIKEYGKAIEDLLKAEQQPHPASSVPLLLAQAYYCSSHTVKAFECLDTELGKNPQNHDAARLRERYAEATKKRFTERAVRIGATDIPTIKSYIGLAIDFGVNIQFHYYKSMQFDGGIQSLRTIKPAAFRLVGESLCISGYCYMRQEERTFNLGRISSLIVNPQQIEFWSES